ncbi:RNA-binding region-containing protein 3-like [Paramacrobiotus metropolitanus]|uniref:RNA-binding region-containing protein 3-like n=1 Tax=Paramacrobiotus metropolitanus TaxID=2943436 RepID=UPI002445BA36|nr:RNA-binding region-containing protein 3-like [Paramacrobiotus metropolitanus]
MAAPGTYLAKPSNREHHALKAPYFNESDSLVIKHLPETFSEDDVRKFLADAGAVEIKYFGSSGRLRNLAIARFDNPDLAVVIMQKLHQIKMGKRRLVVEFADEKLTKHLPMVKENTARSSDYVMTGETYSNYAIPVTLKYHYPPPSPSILTNVMYIMAQTPALYVQVMHLMNKMHLPIPFGPLLPPPKMFDNISGRASEAVDEMVAVSSDSECETELASTVPPRLTKTKEGLPKRKKIKLSGLLETHEMAPVSALPDQDIFDNPFSGQTLAVRRMHIEPPTAERLEAVARSSGDDDGVSGEGFAILKAPEVSPQPDCTASFISAQELDKLRSSAEELLKLPPFKKYDPGQPSSKLYLKNLAEAVEEEDLKFIFGRYVNWNNRVETESLGSFSFSIRLMQEGRMKGQAFITLPNQTKAAEALKEVHGCRIKEKPVVVVFGRSDK